MTEKVKITQDQATAIEYLRDTKFHDEGIIASHARTPMGWLANYTESLNGMPLLKLVDALRIGFEIEEEYKEGDWVVWETEHERRVLQIDQISKLSTGQKVFGDEGFWMVCIKCHATPEEIKVELERQVWKKIGREVGEFVRGDIGIHADNTIFRNADNIRAAYCNRLLKGFYPAESFIKFGEVGE